MQKVQLGTQLPSIEIETAPGQVTNLASMGSKNVVLYFYPKDNTPGCTQEAEDFRDHIKEFEDNDTVIIGVSRDSESSHANFIDQYDLPYDLISDTDEQLCELFDVIKPKNLYGREYMGIERSTFLIDKNGVIQKEWRDVKVGGHVDEVLDEVSRLL